MASSGAVAWTKYFQGKSNLETVLRKDSPSYAAADVKGVKILKTIKAGTKVLYLKAARYESKALVSIEGTEVRVPFDNLAKPGNRASAAPSLKPQAFGIAEKRYSITEYKATILNHIESRQDLSPILKTYLSLLIEYHSDGKADKSEVSKMFLAGKADLPINDINKDFGEVLGPLACIKQQLLKNKNILFTTAAQIWIPSRPNEPLMDYSIIDKEKTYVISAKSGTSTNTVKPSDVITLINKNDDSKKRWESSKELIILKTLDQESALVGPIKALAVLFPDLIKIEQINIQSKEKFNREPFQKFSEENVYLKQKAEPTLNEIMYECEKVIQKESKEGSLNYTNLFSDAIQNSVIYVKYQLDSIGVGSWEVITSDDIKKVNTGSRIFLRSKNGYTRAADKMGIQV